MNRINKIQNLFDQIQEQSVKYNDYVPCSIENIPYRDPSTEEETLKAKKIANKLMLKLSLFSIALIASWVLSLYGTDRFLVKFLLFLMIIISLGITLKEMSKKLQVFTGIVVYKQIRVKDKKSRSVQCTVSIVPENGEKVIYRGINISKKEYIRVTEGTRVLVVNKGVQATLL